MNDLSIPRADPLDTWKSRINLARSILNNRQPSAHIADLARRALDGASLDDLMTLDQER